MQQPDSNNYLQSLSPASFSSPFTLLLPTFQRERQRHVLFSPHSVLHAYAHTNTGCLIRKGGWTQVAATSFLSTPSRLLRQSLVWIYFLQLTFRCQYVTALQPVHYFPRHIVNIFVLYFTCLLRSTCIKSHTSRHH